MYDDDIMRQLTAMFREAFARNDIQLSAETPREQIPGWDSMANVTLAVEIEHYFRIRIKPAEMEAVATVGDLMEIIKRHLQPSLP